MHITYQFERNLTRLPMNSGGRTPTPTAILNLIDQRIFDLRKEEKAIRQICVKLSGFLKVNSIIPFNDEIIDYIQLFLDEEKDKGSAANQDMIRNLTQMIDDYREQLNIYTKDLPSASQDELVNPKNIEEVFDLAAELYTLPINGTFIKEQVDGIKRGKAASVDKFEIEAELPANFGESKLFLDIKELLN